MMEFPNLTDFHSHILPGIDDGSSSLEESLAMLRLEKEQGIRHVVATPHFYPSYDNPAHFLAMRDRAEALLRREMEKYTDLPEITVGAETYFFRGMSESDLLSQLTIHGKRCILIEMPNGHWTDEMYRELAEIWEKRKILPIVAHIDRYITPLRAKKVQRLAQLPVYVQANANFFLDRTTSAFALRLLKADRIQLLGSDCHNLDSRSPNLGEAAQLIALKLGPDVLERIRGYERTVLDL